MGSASGEASVGRDCAIQASIAIKAGVAVDGAEGVRAVRGRDRVICGSVEGVGLGSR